MSATLTLKAPEQTANISSCKAFISDSLKTSVTITQYTVAKSAGTPIREARYPPRPTGVTAMALASPRSASSRITIAPAAVNIMGVMMESNKSKIG